MGARRATGLGLPDMDRTEGNGPLAIVTGAAGQDGFYLVKRLLEDGFVVHGTIHRGGSMFAPGRGTADPVVVIHELEVASRQCWKSSDGGGSSAGTG
jgi:hypothetical protein